MTCRPGEGRDPYAAHYRRRMVSETLFRLRLLRSMGPAFAGTTIDCCNSIRISVRYISAMAHDHHHEQHHHGHAHEHDHAGHSHAPDSFGWAFAIGASLNAAFVVAELA